MTDSVALARPSTSFPNTHMKTHKILMDFYPVLLESPIIIAAIEQENPGEAGQIKEGLLNRSLPSGQFLKAADLIEQTLWGRSTRVETIRTQRNGRLACLDVMSFQGSVFWYRVQYPYAVEGYFATADDAREHMNNPTW